MSIVSFASDLLNYIPALPVNWGTLIPVGFGFALGQFATIARERGIEKRQRRNVRMMLEIELYQNQETLKYQIEILRNFLDKAEKLDAEGTIVEEHKLFFSLFQITWARTSYDKLFQYLLTALGTGELKVITRLYEGTESRNKRYSELGQATTTRLFRPKLVPMVLSLLENDNEVLNVLLPLGDTPRPKKKQMWLRKTLMRAGSMLRYKKQILEK